MYIYAYIYLNYYLVPVNIKNLHGLQTHGNVSQALFSHASPCHTHSRL